MTALPDDFAEERAAATERERGTWRERLRARYPTWTSGLVRGFEVGDGWREVAEDFCRSLDDRLGGEATCPDFRLTQVKQKFGLIRIYFENANSKSLPVVEQVIRCAEDRSRTACEVCREPGSLIERRRYLRVACPAHEHVSFSL